MRDGQTAPSTKTSALRSWGSCAFKKSGAGIPGPLEEASCKNGRSPAFRTRDIRSLLNTRSCCNMPCPGKWRISTVDNLARLLQGASGASACGSDPLANMRHVTTPDFMHGPFGCRTLQQAVPRRSLRKSFRASERNSHCAENRIPPPAAIAHVWPLERDGLHIGKNRLNVKENILIVCL